MDLTAAEVAALVTEAPYVAPEGARTQWEVGGAVSDAAVPIAAPAEHLRHDPADLTVSVDAGVTVATLTDTLGAAGQECVLDPRDPSATVGGVIACGLSGPRRAAHGPVRDRVLEVEFVLGDGRVVRGGGPTVKNVSGYDIPRLLVGSLGTLGLMTRFTLRCTPIPAVSRWTSTTGNPFELRRRLRRPACVAWNGEATWCLLEGHEVDVAEQVVAAGLAESPAPPWPDGAWKGRISVRPSNVDAVAGALRGVEGLDWMAEVGVGTVHVAAQSHAPLRRARTVAADHGGWMLLESGTDIDPWGRALPNRALMRRVKNALDPDGKMNPGRLPW